MSDDRVRIFVSSPSDVEHERAAVKDVVERLSQEYLPYFQLQAVLWEEEALTADRTFQAGLTQPEDCEIVLVILWTRLGSPLPDEPYRGMTGTEWEFVHAVEASARGGKPEVLVYKKTAPKLVDITNAAAALQAVEDQRRLDDFFKGHFFNEDNTFRRAFRTFESDATFRELVEVQLRKLLNRRISADRRASAGPLQWQGNPFRPDRPFEIADERIFTGREAEVRELLSRLSAHGPREPGFLLLSGPSGSGKTSLLRAGLVPRLMRPFFLEQIAIVRCALVHPGTDGHTPLEALAHSLCDADCLGDPLAGFGLGAGELARLLATDPGVASRQLMSALAQLAKTGDGNGGARLALIIDPLEAALDGVAEAELRLFARALGALAATPDIWVIAAIRSDALGRLGALPELRQLLQEGGWTDLEPPASARIRQMVEIPARIAGLEVESAEDSGGRGLVEQIETDAAPLRLWTPPVQGVLDRAYREARSGGDDGEVRLTAEQYRAAGGLAGHIRASADALWEQLDEAARSALPRLCRALIGTDGTGSSQPQPRRGGLDRLRADPDCRRLLDALIEARLIIAEGVRDTSLLVKCDEPDYRLGSLLRGSLRQGRAEWLGRWLPGRARRLQQAPSSPVRPSGAEAEAEGMPVAIGDDSAGHIDWRAYRAVASFSHPLMIQDWAPVRAWLAQPDNRRLLQLRSQLTRQAGLWKRTDCNREYLYGEAGYAAASELMRVCGDELEPLELEFLRQSEAHIGFLRRRNRFVRGVGVVLLALVVAATAAAGLALRKSQEARVNLHRTKLKEADLFIAGGNTPQAVIEAIAAGEDLPERAVQVLSLAFSSNRLMGMAESAGPALGDPRVPGFNADGTRLATIVPGQGPRLWRLDGGRFVADRDLQADGLGLHSLVIGADEQVLGIGAGGIWRLPASEGAPPLYPCGSGAGAMFTLDAARRYLAIARNLRGEHHGVCVIDLAQDGKVLLDRELNEGEIRGLSFSPDGNALLTASAHGRTHVFDLMTGEIRLSLPAGGALGRPFNNAVFDQAGERIAIAAVDERVRLYGGDGTPIGELSDSDIGGRRFKIHRTAVRDVAFAPDGAFLVAVDDQGQVVRWSLDGSEQAVVLGNHDLSITDLEIVAQPDPGLSDQPLVLTASLDHTARLWGLATGRPVAVLGHDAAVTAARFSDNGNHVLTFSERDGTARLWSIDPVSRLTYRIRHPDHVWNLDMVAAPTELAPSGAGLLLATAGFDGGVRVWRYDRTLDEAKPEPLATFTEHGGRVRQVRFSPSGRLLSSAGYDGSAWVHDLVGGTACRASITGKRGGDEVYNALFGPDARWLLTTSNDSERPVRLFSATTCAPVDAGDAMRHGDAPVQAAAVQPVGGGALVATGDERGTVRLLFQGADGVWHKHCEVAAGIGPIGDIALSADGSLAGAVGTASRAVLLAVEADACRAPAYLNGHTERVYSIAIGPDSRRVVTASLDKTARVWGSDGTALAVLVGHQDRVYRAAFSPDGRWILSASRDGSIQLWQTPTATSGPEQRLSAFLPLRADLGGVANAMFSPGGRYIAGAYWENAALLWRLWSEADEVPSERTARWGRERARLALIGEAYRFRDENAVVDNDALEQAERE